MKKALSILIIVLAVGMAVVPTFTDCLSQGRSLKTATGMSVPMKCHWSGLAEIGAAVPLALSGFFMLRSKRKEDMRNLSMMGIASGVVAILFPTVLIGVCASNDMMCNMVMRPTLIAMSTIAIAASVYLFVTAPKVEEPAAMAVAA